MSVEPRISSAPTARVTYWAAARAAAGVPCDDVEISSTTTVQELLDEAARRHGPELVRVLSVASVLVDDLRIAPEVFATTPVSAGSQVQVLPPFAGG